LAPKAGRIQTDAQLAGDLGIVETGRSSENDPGAYNRLMSRRMPMNQRLQGLAFRFGQADAGGPRAAGQERHGGYLPFR